MRKTLSGLLISIAVLSPAAPKTKAADAITEVFLGGIERKAKGLMGRARSDANDVVNNAANRAIDVIQAWKAANKELLDVGFDRLDGQTKKLFSEIDKDLTRLEQDQKLIVRDVQSITTQWSSLVKNLPFTNDSPEVVDYFPRVFLPIGDEDIPFQIVGPKVSTASPQLKFSGLSQSVNRSTDNLIVVKISRSKIAFDPEKAQLQLLELKLTRSTTTWWKPFTWFSKEEIKRELTVQLMPRVMAKVTIVPRYEVSSVERSTFSAPAGGKGKDSPYPVGIIVPPDLFGKGWVIDTDNLIDKKTAEWVADTGGDNGSCGSFDRNSLSSKGFTFMIQLGHKTDNFGKKSDAWQNCQLTVPIMRTSITAADKSPVEVVMDWTADKRVELPADTKTYSVTVKMFNGRTYELTAQSKEPFGLIDIERVNDHTIIFHPRAPTDF